MAGAIVVTKGSVVSMGTFNFNYIIESTRDFFPPEQSELCKQIYHPHDEEYVMAIGFLEPGAEHLKAFLSATEAAYKHAMETDREHTPDLIWQEVIERLRADPRSQE